MEGDWVMKKNKAASAGSVEVESSGWRIQMDKRNVYVLLPPLLPCYFTNPDNSATPIYDPKTSKAIGYLPEEYNDMTKAQQQVWVSKVRKHSHSSGTLERLGRQRTHRVYAPNRMKMKMGGDNPCSRCAKRGKTCMVQASK